MVKLRVGIVIDPLNTPTHGGSFSYYQTLLNGINEFDFDNKIEIVNLVFYNESLPVVQYKNPSLYIKTSTLLKIKDGVGQSTPFLLNSFVKQNPTLKYVYTILRKRKNEKVERLLAYNKIDVLYYLNPEVGLLLNYPFIATHWDVGHRSMYPFPEVAQNGNYEIREGYYNFFLNRALLILCESKAGAVELKKIYTYYQPKIKIVPIFASDIIKLSCAQSHQEETLSKYGLKKQRFYLYPAQFWAHKNHYNLILAFKQIAEKEGNGDLKLVLCGSDKGNLAYVKELIGSLSLQDKIVITGFICEEELYAFYKNTIALVMPTFLGPTNMPLIEAAHLKCPVLCSDFEGHKEILGANALYFNPSKADEIEKAMLQVLVETNRRAWVDAAHDQISQSPFNLQKSLAILNDILLDIIPIRKTWGIE